MTANVSTVLLCFVFVTLFAGSSCTCSWPTALHGSWYTSESKIWVFDTTNLTLDFGTYGSSGFECYTTDGYRYLARIANVLVFPNIPGYFFDIFICLEFQQLSTNSFLFWRANNEHSSLNFEKAFMRGIGFSTATSQACEITKPYASGTHDIMLKVGFETTGAVKCPTPFNALTYYYYDYDQAKECGPSNSSFDGCANTNVFSFNYNSCSDNTVTMLYSSGGALYCLYYTTDSGTTYLTVLNQDASPDGSTTYRFSCLAFTQAGTTIFATQHPQACHSTQTSTYVPVPGNDLFFGVESTCDDQEPHRIQLCTANDERHAGIPQHSLLAYSCLGYPGGG